VPARARPCRACPSSSRAVAQPVRPDRPAQGRRHRAAAPRVPRGADPPRAQHGLRADPRAPAARAGVHDRGAGARDPAGPGAAEAGGPARARSRRAADARGSESSAGAIAACLLPRPSLPASPWRRSSAAGRTPASRRPLPMRPSATSAAIEPRSPPRRSGSPVRTAAAARCSRRCTAPPAAPPSRSRSTSRATVATGSTRVPSAAPSPTSASRRPSSRCGRIPRRGSDRRPCGSPTHGPLPSPPTWGERATRFHRTHAQAAMMGDVPRVLNPVRPPLRTAADAAFAFGASRAAAQSDMEGSPWPCESSPPA